MVADSAKVAHVEMPRDPRVGQEGAFLSSAAAAQVAGKLTSFYDL